MKTTTTFAIAIATLLALGGGAMAASQHRTARSHWSAAQGQDFYGARAQGPFGADASSPGVFGGRFDLSASQPGFNPALDRAKGSL